MRILPKLPNDEPTTELYIPKIVERLGCAKHNAAPRKPCFVIPTLAGQYLMAVCNTRAVSAGCNHPIDPRSLQTGRRTKA